MANRLKRSIIIALTVLFGAFALSAPVFADPNTVVPEDTESSVTTTTPEEGEETITDFSEEDRETCYSAAKHVAWLVCPGTGFLASVIDGAFGALEDMLKIQPLSSDANSPFHIVWEYARNITNAIFGILLLVMIVSQVSGFGLSSYGVKKYLPRLIISALLANVSFLICQIGLDLSTIAGSGLYKLFSDLQASALANGGVTEFAQSLSISDLTSAILGVGVAGGATLTVALAMNGGLMGLLSMLIPVVLGGVIAVAVAIMTMAARQALVYLLVMIAPLAFVAYTMPNMNRWFQKWSGLFIGMIVFYPMFALLYGASQLAGATIIASSTHWLTVILGIAVRVLPLALTLPMLRMSSTVLGNIDRLVHRATNPIERTAGRFAMEQRELARQRQLFNPNPIAPSTHLAQYLQRRAETRRHRTAEYARSNKDSYVTNAIEESYRGGRANDQFLADSYLIEARLLRNQIARTQARTDLDEGLSEDRVSSARARAQIRNTNSAFEGLVIDDHLAKSRQHSVTMQNTASKARRIEEAIKDQTSNIHQQFLDTYRYSDDSSQAAQQSLGSVLSTAISARERIDSEAEKDFYTLFNSMPAGEMPKQQLTEAIKSSNYNAMGAAMDIIYKRGDKDFIEEVLRDLTTTHAANFQGDEGFAMRKHLADKLITYKEEDLRLGIYGKSLMMREAMSQVANPDKHTSSFISFADFTNDVQLAEDGDAAFAKVNFSALTKAENSNKAYTSIDRTALKRWAKDIEEGLVTRSAVDLVNDPGGRYLPWKTNIKHIREMLCDGREGDKLNETLHLITLDFNGAGTAYAANEQQIINGIEDLLKDATATQIKSMRSDTFARFDEVLRRHYGLTGEPTDRYCSVLRNLIQNQISSLNGDNMAETRNSMNAGVRKKLGIDTDR